MIALAALLGLVIGAVIGGVGGGGGVLTVPVLVYVLGQSAQDATTASVVIVGIAAAVGVLARVRAGGVDWRTGAVFGVVGIPAAWLGTVLNHRVSEPILMLAFAGLTLAAAAAMLLHARSTRRAVEHADQDATPDHARGGCVADESHNIRLARLASQEPHFSAHMPWMDFSIFEQPVDIGVRGITVHGLAEGRL